jgi:hypothetical protein
MQGNLNAKISYAEQVPLANVSTAGPVFQHTMSTRGVGTYFSQHRIQNKVTNKELL